MLCSPPPNSGMFLEATNKKIESNETAKRAMMRVYIGSAKSIYYKEVAVKCT
jgi:hypothetical protein